MRLQLLRYARDIRHVTEDEMPSTSLMFLTFMLFGSSLKKQYTAEKVSSGVRRLYGLHADKQQHNKWLTTVHQQSRS
ncbi:hypothetical protein ABVT39_009772 [Epinephelus coioides]